MDSATATIACTFVAVPEHAFTQDDVKRVLHDVLPSAFLHGSGVSQRHSVLPLEALQRPRTLGETMGLYREHSLRLGRTVAAGCLERAGVAANQVDLIVTVSCTGFMVPSLDAYLANDLGLRPDVRRLPITQLGCFAGAAALAHARDFVIAYPDAHVLVVSVELPTLSFQRGDASAGNLASTALFGDGAAAVMVTGRPVPGAAMLATASHLVPKSLEVLGFDLRDDGFHAVLGRALPQIVRAQAPALVRRLLDRAGVQRSAVSAYVLHPGGPRVLEAAVAALELRAEQIAPSWSVLREYGNLSSASVLFVLDRWMTDRRPAAGTHAVLGAFGPGFSAELVLLQWR